MKKASARQLKIAKIIALVFGFVFLPVSIIAVIAAPLAGIFILAINICLFILARACSKTLKALSSAPESILNNRMIAQMGIKDFPERALAMDPPQKEEKIKIPSYIGDYKLTYQYKDVWFDITGSTDNSDAGKKIKFEIQNGDVSVSIDGRIIGTIPDNRQKDMIIDFTKNNEPIYAILTANNDSGSGQMFLAFYRLPKYQKLLKRGDSHQSFKLSGTGKEEYQENILLCSEGDEVEVEFDDDKEKYLASCGLEIGYFPKKAEPLLENGSEVFISSIDYDDNGKSIVSVDVFD